MTAPSPDLGRIVVDPRFRERRIAVRKEAGRRRLRRLLLLVAVAALALATVIVLRSPVLDVDAVSVSGARFSGAEVVREATGIDIGAPLLLADLDAAEARIEALPFVDDATVTRDLPGGVVVEVTERAPASIVQVGPQRVLVDDTGRVLAAGDPATYPRAATRGPAFVPVVAPSADPPPAVGRLVDRDLLAAVSLSSRLRGNPAGAVAAVRVEPSLELDLAAGGVAVLGDATDLDAKVEALRTALARIDLACAERLDLRVPTHPVLTRGDACS